MTNDPHRIQLPEAIEIVRGLSQHLTTYRWALACETVAKEVDRLQERDRLLTKFASSLLDRLAECDGTWTPVHTPQVIADWRAAMEKFGR